MRTSGRQPIRWATLGTLLASACLAHCGLFLSFDEYRDGPSHVWAGDAGDAMDTSAADRADACDANVSVDPQNCGACGHDCLGGECEDGRCQPMVLASDLAEPSHLALDRSRVYCTDRGGGRIVAVDKSARSLARPEVLVLDASPYGIAVDDTHLYWTTADDGRLMRVKKADTQSPQELAAGEDLIEVVVDDTHAYCTDWAGNVVMALDKSNVGAPVELVAVDAGWGAPEGLAVDATHVYVTEMRDNGRVIAVEKASGDFRTLASDLPGPRLLTADDTHLYWANYAEDTIMRLPKGGGGAPEILAGNQAMSEGGVAVDDTHLYASVFETGLIIRVPKAGGDVEVIASGQASPKAIAVDEEAVYWATKADGAIKRWAK